MTITHTIKITKYKDGMFSDIEDTIAEEFPLTVYINDIEFATLVCSPDHLEDLVLGFLASEGVISSKEEVQAMNLDDYGGYCHVTLNKNIQADHFHYTKRIIGSCCGKSRQFYFQNDRDTAKVSMAKITLSPEQCISLMKEMQETSTVFKETGGIHNASIASPENTLVHRGDIGRHNALDKLYGHCIAENISVRDKVIVFSGRISSEVLTKAAKIGVGIVLSKSAPTDMAIKLAHDLNITAVGFIRGHSFNIYSHPWRIKTPTETL
jgi:FdhD protein